MEGATRAATDAWGDGSRTVEVETPEQVQLAFELADLGSRFLALVLDVMVLFGLLGGLGVLALWIHAYVKFPLLVGSAAVAVYTIIVFLVAWGYFVYFEGFRHGRTPGKRWTGIRVVYEGGYPLTVRGAVIRNLVRIVDMQPVISCIVGGAAMMVGERTQRLGDLAAGTLVVRDRADAPLPEAEVLPSGATGLPRLDDREFEMLDRFAARSADLAPDVLARVATGVARALGQERLADAPTGLDEVQKLLHLHGEERQRRAWGAGASRTSALAAALFHERQDVWHEYEALLDRARGLGLASLPDATVSRFASLYRLVSADLARVRTYGGSGALAYSLERLVAEGHNLFYRRTGSSWRALWEWLAAGFPRLVRTRRTVIAIAATVLFGPALVTYATVRADPSVARRVLPTAMIVRAENAPARLRSGLGYIDAPSALMPLMSSRIMTNNVQVTLFCFAGGVLAGLGSLILLALNGIYLGAMLGLYDAYGAGPLIWTFVAPHGVLELGAICISGGAGLWLGSGLLFPGRLGRFAAMAERAQEAVSLLAGTTLLLVLAGSVEAFVSPSPLGAGLRLAVAGALALSFLAYIVFAGRGARADGPVTGAPGTSPRGSGSPPR